MKAIRRLVVGLFVLTVINSCAVVTPDSKNVLPIIQAASIQHYVGAHIVRWLSLTNASTPYAISNVSALVETNITVTVISVSNTNVTTNITPQVHLQINSTADYSFTYSMDIYYSLYGQYSATATNMWFTDMAEANTSLSNASMVNLRSVDISYSVGNTTINTSISNMVFSGKSSSIAYITNNEVYFSSILNSTDPVLFTASGADDGVDFTASYKLDSLTYRLEGSQADTFQNILGVAPGFVTIGEFTYFYQILYTGETNLIAEFPTVQSYDGDLTVDLKTGL